MDIFARLRALSAPVDEWRCVRIDPASPDGRRQLEDLLSAGAVTSVHDTIHDQLRDLAETRRPRQTLTTGEAGELVVAELGGRTADEYGTWVYYPWSGKLVHVLPEAAFRELRADRNRNKITTAEQAELRRFTVGVVGLSVGLSVAVTLALEGIGGRLRLADFDTLALSNLNRLRAGVHDLGVNKAVLAARQIAELDPYLDIEVFADGVTDANLDAFFAGTGPLHLLVEECDDLYMKVRLREEAARRRVPVLMDTSDRGLLDVERFDRDPDRRPFHGLIGDTPAAALRGLATRDKVPFILRILDAGQLSAELGASLVDVKETLSTWPQLGSAVALGGAVTADAARRLLLGRLNDSGRYYVDLNHLVRDGAGVPLPGPPEPDDPPVGAEPAALPPAPPPGSGRITRDEVRFVVAHAVLAPSAGNSQPWRFEWDGEVLRCVHDPERVPSFLDYEFRATYLGFGAAVENLVLAAGAIGLLAAVVPCPAAGNASRVAEIRFARCPRPGRPPALFLQIPLRLTNRRRGEARPLAAEDLAALASEAAAGGGRLQVISDAARLRAAAEVLARGDRVRFLNPSSHAEIRGELRLTNRAARQARDGIDLATLDATPADRAAFDVLCRSDVADALRRTGGGHGLGKAARDAMASAAGLALLTFPDDSPAGYFRAGRVLERVWLTATARGVAIHPWSVLPYLFRRLEVGGGHGFDPTEKAELTDIRGDYKALFDVRPGDAEALLFKLAYSPVAASRSLRRPLDTFLAFTG